MSVKLIMNIKLPTDTNQQHIFLTDVNVDPGYDPDYRRYEYKHYTYHYKGNALLAYFKSLPSDQLPGLKKVMEQVSLHLLGGAQLHVATKQRIRVRWKRFRLKANRLRRQQAGGEIVNTPPPASNKQQTMITTINNKINEEVVLVAPIQSSSNNSQEAGQHEAKQPSSSQHATKPSPRATVQDYFKQTTYVPVSDTSTVDTENPTKRNACSLLCQADSADMDQLMTYATPSENTSEKCSSGKEEQRYLTYTLNGPQRTPPSATQSSPVVRVQMRRRRDKEQSDTKSDQSDISISPQQVASLHTDDLETSLREPTQSFNQQMELNVASELRTNTPLRGEETMQVDSESDISGQTHVQHRSVMETALVHPTVYDVPIIEASSQQYPRQRSLSIGAPLHGNTLVKNDEWVDVVNGRVETLDLAVSKHNKSCKIYQYISQIVNSCSEFRDVIVYKFGKSRTRSNEVMIVDQESQRMQTSSTTQQTYGHYTHRALLDIMDGLIKPWKIFPQAQLSNMYGMNMHSAFLDIGSGFGFPNFTATCLTGCKGLGLEFVSGRVQLSRDVLNALQQGKIVKDAKWKELIEFWQKDACSEDGPFTINDTHITHVFAYNWAQKDDNDYMRGVIRRLNKTDFKLLAWSADAMHTIDKYGLNARLVGSQASQTWGGTTHQMYFYAKLEPDQLHQSSRTNNQHGGDPTSKSASLEQSVIDQDESFEKVDTTKLVDQGYELMMTYSRSRFATESKVIAPITQASQHGDYKMKESECYVKGSTANLMNATSSVKSPQHTDSILGKRKYTQALVHPSENFLRNNDATTIENAVTVTDIYTEAQQQETEAESSHTLRCQIDNKRDLKKFHKQWPPIMTDLMTKAEKVELESYITTTDPLKWTIKSEQLQLINRKFQCTLTSMIMQAGSYSVFIGEMDNDSKDKITVKVYFKKFIKMARRENTAIKRMHMDKESHSFVANKRYNRGETSDTMVFMDHHPCSLRTWIQMSPPINFLKLQLHHLVSSVAYCHIKGVAHRDIQPVNVAMDKHLVPLLINFGMSCIRGEEPNWHNEGSRDYMAPEVQLYKMKRNMHGAKQADCWSLGLTIYNALYNELPFKGVNWKESIRTKNLPAITVSAIEQQYSNDNTELPHYYQFANELIKGLLKVDPSTRTTAEEATKHPFFKELHNNNIHQLPNDGLVPFRGSQQ